MNREPPYYKQLDPAKQAGQTVNTIKTLDQYVEKVLAAEAPPKKKLTFDEWWCKHYAGFMKFEYYSESEYMLMEAAWDAAQENK